MGNLVQERAVRKRGTTGKRVITDSGLPVPGNDELSAIKKLGSSQEGPRKIGTVEYRFKKVRTVQTGARQIRIAEVSPSQICAPKVRPRKIETGQVNSSQTGPRQVRRLIVLPPPRVPRCSASLEQRDVVIVWHLPPLSNHRGALFHC